MRNVFLVFLCFFSFAFAKNEIDATLEVIKKVDSLPKIVVQDASKEYNQKEFTPRVVSMLVADLKVTGHFVASEEKALDVLNFDSFRASKVDLLAKISSSRVEKGLIIDLKLYDVNSGNVVFGKEYNISKAEAYPFLVHKVAMDINNYVKAPAVDWMARKVILAYYTKSGESDIIYADYTLTFKEKVISGGLNIFPKWANLEQSAFYYTKYLDKPTLFKYDFLTGKQERILNSNGMLVASDVSKDGKKLLLTMAPNEQADIFLYDVDTKTSVKLTKYSGIDVSGNFIDDEKRVMFISDRLGYPNVFAIPINGEAAGNVEQLVYHGRNNNAANAYGNYIVYSSRETSSEFDRNTFNLYLVSTKSDFIRRLSGNGVNQLPRFSHDGETIMYIKHEGNQSALGVIRLNYNKTLLFPLKGNVIQSMDW